MLRAYRRNASVFRIHTAHVHCFAGHQHEARQVSSSSDVNTPVSRVITTWWPAAPLARPMRHCLSVHACRNRQLVVPATAAAAAVAAATNHCHRHQLHSSGINSLTTGSPNISATHYGLLNMFAVVSPVDRLALAHGWVQHLVVQPTQRQQLQQQLRQQQQCRSPAQSSCLQGSACPW